MEAGPKLDPEREQAILGATLDLLAEGGYEALRLDAVASRAKASKATLYRHWPGKAELVVDAVSVTSRPTSPTRSTPAACAGTCSPR